MTTATGPQFIFVLGILASGILAFGAVVAVGWLLSEIHDQVIWRRSGERRLAEMTQDRNNRLETIVQLRCELQKLEELLPPGKLQEGPYR
jgi:hypothetical protein